MLNTRRGRDRRATFVSLCWSSRLDVRRVHLVLDRSDHARLHRILEPRRSLLVGVEIAPAAMPAPLSPVAPWYRPDVGSVERTDVPRRNARTQPPSRQAKSRRTEPIRRFRAPSLPLGAVSLMG
jgi:hypothetical protein